MMTARRVHAGADAGWWLIVPHKSAAQMSGKGGDPKDPRRSQHLTEGAWLRAYVEAGIRKAPTDLSDAEQRHWRQQFVAVNAATFARLPGDLARLCPKELRP